MSWMAPLDADFDFSICGFGQVQVEHFVGFAVARQPPKGGERRRG
jgi:hypothetical protein